MELGNTLFVVVLGASFAACQPAAGTSKRVTTIPTAERTTPPAPRSFGKLFEVPGNDGKCMAYAGGKTPLAVTRKDDGRIRLHEVHGSRTLAELGTGEQVAIGKLGVAVREGPVFRFYDASGKLLSKFEHGFGEGGGLASETPFSDDGQRVFVGGRERGCFVSSVPAFTPLWQGKCIGLAFADPHGTRVVRKQEHELIEVDANTLLAKLPIMAISSNNSLLLTQDSDKGGDKTLRVVEANTGQVISTLQTIEPRLNWESKTVFSEDGSTVLVRDVDDRIRIWDVKSGRHLRDRPREGEYAGGIALSADGKRFAVGGTPGGVWDVETGAQILTLPKTNYDLVFHPNGHRFIANQLGQLHGYDLDSGKQLFEVEVRADESLFTSNGEQIVTSDGECKLLNVADGKVLGHVGGSRFFCDSGHFLADGRYLCAGSNVLVIDAERGTIERQCQSDLGWRTRFEISTNERYLVTRYALFDRTTCQNTTTGEDLAEHQIAPNGRHVATTRGPDTDRALWVTDTRDQSTRRLRTIGRGLEIFTWLGEHRIALRGEDGLELISISTAEATNLDTDGADDLSTLAATPDGSWLVAVSNGSLRVWNTSTPDEPSTEFPLATIAPPPRLANFITQRLADSWERWAFTPDSSTMLLLSETHQLHLVSLVDGAVLGSLGDSSHPIASFAVSPDGRWLATGTKCDEARSEDACARGRVELRSLPDLELQGSDQAKHAEIKDVSFNAQSNRLATLRSDGLVIWSLPE